MWLARKQRPGETLCFYDTAHDHDFSLLTAGYYGPGYGTRVYDYDKSQVIGLAREKVALRFLEDTTLPVGKVMLYREDLDIHIQFPPKELSVSINLMRYPDLDRSRRPDQCYLDLDNQTILRKADKVDAGVLILLAGALGSDNTVGILSDIMKSHPHRRTRLYSYEAVAQRSGDQVWEQALLDSDKLLRTIAEQKLNARSPSTLTGCLASTDQSAHAQSRAPGIDATVAGS